MPGQIVHFEIPADDTQQGREFWGLLFGWEFEAAPGPFEYFVTRTGEQSGAAITNMQPGKKGARAYFDVEDINAGAARVRELGGEAGDPDRCPGWAGLRPAQTRRETSSASGRPTRRRRTRPDSGQTPLVRTPGRRDTCRAAGDPDDRRLKGPGGARAPGRERRVSSQSQTADRTRVHRSATVVCSKTRSPFLPASQWRARLRRIRLAPRPGRAAARPASRR